MAENEGWGESWSNYTNESTWQVLETLYAVAKEAEKTPAQAAINWLLNQPAVTSPIIGARTMEQLEANLGASGWSLTKEQIVRLNKASDLYVTYHLMRML
ncbi:aldo/keto reductase [Bacillus sp. ISL-18]|uniref:aldo/keto reductase n=1 Tax=Bacillus sp. ISL-18 TaxID=2819118 RepID=UPI001BE5307F|nr:aldo/keto reductase [Bacillus sp. ISL-18]MBT2655844.1 aldo/keto reductase [Bacillus sp. ISL-18]